MWGEFAHTLEQRSGLPRFSRRLGYNPHLAALCGDTADAIIHISYFAGGLAISPNGSQIAVADLHSVDLIHITAH